MTALPRAIAVRPKQSWQTAIDTVVLEFDDRYRRRLAMTTTRGFAFLLDLPETMALRGGDALVLEDSRLIEVVAAPEPLLEIRGADAVQLARAAWHLGNRHLATQFTGRALRIRRDHVIEAILRGLGLRLIEIEAPFDPEGGAYAHGGADQIHSDGAAHDPVAHHRHHEPHAHHHQANDHTHSHGHGYEHENEDHHGRTHEHGHDHHHEHGKQ